MTTSGYRKITRDYKWLQVEGYKWKVTSRYKWLQEGYKVVTGLQYYVHVYTRSYMLLEV